MEIRLSKEYLDVLDRRRFYLQSGLFVKDRQVVYGPSAAAVVAAMHIGPELTLQKGGRRVIRAG